MNSAEWDRRYWEADLRQALYSGTSMANYRSLVGGFFNDPDKDSTPNPSIRYNNPGAINAVDWVKHEPGYVGNSTIKGNNPIAIFETPEQGAAVWLKLMQKYAYDGDTTIHDIILHYGGEDQKAKYEQYAAVVAQRLGVPSSTEIDLDDDDSVIPFAKEMFAYEAARPTPLSDKQIAYGFELARGHVPEQPKSESFVDWLIELIKAFLNLWHVPQPKPKAPKGGAPWVNEVRKCTGIKETVDGAIILSWRDDIARAFPEMKGYAYLYTSPTKQPWCGHGLAAALARCLIRPPFGPTDILKYMWADSYAHDWGVKLDKPITGCIGVRTRNGGGHVTMVEKYGDGILYCRGFNQSDAVTVARYELDDKWTGFYWPKGYPIVNVEPDISNAVAAGKES